jgi:hypothetical protein
VSFEHIPPSIETLLLVVVGNNWPDGDTGQLRSDATAWRQASQTLSSIGDSANMAANMAEQGMTGPAGEAFTNYWKNFTGGDQGFFQVLAQVCDELADSLDEAADQIETVRIDIIISVSILAAELAWDAAMAFWTGGASMAAAAEEIAATRLTVLRYLSRAAVELVEHEVKQTLQQFLIDLIAQAIEKREHPGKQINWQEAGDAAINGAVGGAVGDGAGLLFKGVGKGLSKLDQNLFGGKVTSGLDNLADKPWYVRLPTQMVGDIAVNEPTNTAEAAAQDAALDDGQVSHGDPIAGAQNAIGNGAFGRGRNFLKGVKGTDEPIDLAIVKLKGLTKDLFGSGQPTQAAHATAPATQQPPQPGHTTNNSTTGNPTVDQQPPHHDTTPDQLPRQSTIPDADAIDEHTAVHDAADTTQPRATTDRTDSTPPPTDHAPAPTPPPRNPLRNTPAHTTAPTQQPHAPAPTPPPRNPLRNTPAHTTAPSAEPTDHAGTPHTNTTNGPLSPPPAPQPRAPTSDGTTGSNTGPQGEQGPSQTNVLPGFESSLKPPNPVTAADETLVAPVQNAGTDNGSPDSTENAGSSTENPVVQTVADTMPELPADGGNVPARAQNGPADDDPGHRPRLTRHASWP